MRSSKPTPFGRAVKKALLDAEMNQEQLAEALSMHSHLLSDILYGRKAGYKYKAAIVQLLRMDPRWLNGDAA